MTNTRFPFVCWGLSDSVRIHNQHTVCTHSLRLEDLSPHHTPHFSLLKSKHHLWSPVLLFPPGPSNERAHSLLPPSLTRALSVASAFQPSPWLTLGQTDVTLSIFYLVFRVRGTSCCSPGYTRTKSSYHQVWGHINTHTEIGCIHFVPWSGHSVVGGWVGGGCHSCTHMTHMSHICTHTLTTHTVGRELCLVWLQSVKRSWMTAERWQRLAGEYSELPVWATLT